MEALLWILLPGFVAVASGILSWFVMQSRMEVALAQLRERLAESRGALESERSAVRDSVEIAVRAAEERAHRHALDSFLAELKIERRHYTRENRLALRSRRSVILQERMCFRNLPLSDWIEHEIPLDEGADIERLVQDMTVFDKAVVNIADIPRQRKALA
jgi:hypothetical protein